VAPRQAERRLRRQAEERLAEAVAPLHSPPRKVRTAVLVGVPFVEVIRAVQERRYDLVFTGTRGLSGVKRLLVGSTAERLVRKCPCPVWVVKPGREGPPCSLLAPVDFSAVSGRALRLAASLAGLFDCPLSVLHVLSAPTDLAPAQEEDGPWDARRRRRAVREAVGEHLSAFVGSHVPAGVPVKEMLALGTPWQRIGVVARHGEVDLILLGSVGRAGIPGLLLGNTAERVLRHGDRSLLAVKPEGFVSPVQPVG
jgi:nucleotide-binding universal stress UspA family protein